MVVALASSGIVPVSSPPSVCTSTQDFTDANGAYVTSACYVCGVPLPFGQANSFCNNNQMILFNVNQTDLNPDVLTYAKDLLGANYSGNVYLDGNNPPACSSIKGVNGNYSLEQIDCNQPLCFLCEYELESESNHKA